jgi:hypothetical protein
MRVQRRQVPYARIASLGRLRLSDETTEETDVAEPSTLAVQVLAVFSKFAENAAPSNAHETRIVIECWWRTLHGQRPQDDELLASIAAIGAQVRRLHRQVSQSRLLARAGKTVTLQVVDGLMSLLKPELFNRAVQDFRANYTQDRLGTLEVLVHALKQENPEATLSGSDLAKLTADVEALVEAVASAKINPDLKALLMRHASLMAWVIRNSAFVGIQGIYEAVAGMMVTAQRLPEQRDARSSEASTAATLKAFIFEKCKLLFGVLRNAETADKGLQAIEHLVGGGEKLLEVIGSLIES